MQNMLPLVIMLVTSGLTACSSYSGNVRTTDQSAIDKIKIGTTTKDEVRSLMGEPSSIRTGVIGNPASILRGGIGDPSSINRGGTNKNWTYSYRQTNIGAKAFIPFANLVGEKAVDVKSNFLMIMFDEKGIVENVMSRIAGNK